MEATLANGEPLPDYIEFDAENGTFTIDGNAALEQGVEQVEVRIVGRDGQGNEATGTFQIKLVSAAEPAAEENAGETGAAETGTGDTAQAPTVPERR